jgi:hypothetical protein
LNLEHRFHDLEPLNRAKIFRPYSVVPAIMRPARESAAGGLETPGRPIFLYFFLSAKEKYEQKNFLFSNSRTNYAFISEACALPQSAFCVDLAKTSFYTFKKHKSFMQETLCRL